MIIANGVPKSGTTLLSQFLMASGFALEPGGLMAYAGDKTLHLKGGAPWAEVRSLDAVLAHTDRDRVIGAHVYDGIDLAPHTVVYIHRHPKDILLSRARWMAVGHNWQDAADEPSITAICRHMGLSDVTAVLGNLRDFQGWLKNAALVVKFDDLVRDPDVVGNWIGKELGFDAADPDQFMGEKAPWLTPEYRGTWSGQHSQWMTVWNDLVDRHWHQHGGPEIEEAYGYA